MVFLELLLQRSKKGMPVPFPNMFRIKLMTNESIWLIIQDKLINLHEALHSFIFATNYLINS